MATCEAESEQNMRYTVSFDRGEFMSGQAPKSGHALKSPHAGRHMDDYRKELANEAKIYLHLGFNMRLVPIISFSYQDGLCLEYMPNVDLKAYLRQYDDNILLEQRQRWACEVAEGLQVYLQVLHSAIVRLL